MHWLRYQEIMPIIISTKKMLAYWKVAYYNPGKLKDQ